MEILLQHLREHQEATFGMYRPDDRRAEEGQQEKPLRKYVSVFRIDGEPIIPPLMTSEKRRQMQVLREKAMKIEQRLKERRQRISRGNYDVTAKNQSETSRSSACNTAGNISQRSQDYYEAKLKESQESVMLLEDIIRRQSGGEETMHRNTANVWNAHVHQSPRFNQDKLKKLQKSETLIYDNSTNEVIKQISCDEEGIPQSADHEITLRELERKANLNYVQPKKPSHLLLAGINDKGGVTIPSICLNPPTPLVYNRNICDDSLTTADLSSDDSFNSMLTHSDVRPPPESDRKNGLPRSEKMHDFKAYNSPTNVTAKIQQFEAISSNHSTPTVTPHSSPDKTVLARSNLGPTAAISRSATSPSIKLTTFQPRPQTTPEFSQNTTDNTLIRSSSFTLEAPSKVLIDHMRQQRTSKDSSCNMEVVKVMSLLTSPQNTTRKISSPSRVQRDTIESKAKRVQKVELKPSRQKTQQKTSQHRLAHAAAASMSSPNSSSFPSHTSTAHLYKTKKSPYDTPKSTRSIGLLPKTSATQVRKSPTSSASSVTSQKLNKLKSPATGKQTTASALSPKSPCSEKEALTQMDKIKKEKFLRLLKQQEEEQQKLKQVFEMQQKLLIEQLNKEMAATHIQIPTSKSESTPRTSLNMELSGFSADSVQHQQSMDGEQSTLISPALSNHRSLESETTITQQNSCDYMPQVPSLPISSLSSMDHSNANTSLDSSCIAANNQHSQRAVATSETNALTPEENGHISVNDSGHMSSSRRRLFSQDIVEISLSSCAPQHSASMHPHCSRSSSNHRLSGTQVHQVNVSPNKEHVVLSNRRLPIDEHVANAAATKINAFVRGFLVRRLFQTEQIQRIVQTIRDTLIFVLNLHLETCENIEANTAANIKLKARLLQQLSSATRTLHLVLFQTSIKERMDIIARDRKRIKTKLLAMNRKRTPWIAG